MTNKERIILFLLAALNFTHTLDFMIMMPLGNYLSESFKISAFQFSVLVGAYSISAFLSGLTISLFIDRFDRKSTLMYAYTGFLFGTVGCGFAGTYELLLTARIVTGIFGGIIGAQVLSIVADIFSYQRRGRAVGAVMAGFAIASILGVPVSLYLTNLLHKDWHVPFLLIGAIGLILLPLVGVYIPSVRDHIIPGQPNRENRSVFAALVKVWQIIGQRQALIFSGMLMVGHFLIIPFINPYLEFNKGFTKDQTPMIFLAGGAASLVAALYLGKLADRYGKLYVFSMSVILSLFLVFLVTQLPDIPFSLVLLIFSVLFVFATGRIIAAQAMVSEVVPAQHRGSFMSINGSIRELGSGLAALAAGVIVHTDSTGKIHNYEWVGYLSIVVLVITLFFARNIFRELDIDPRNALDSRL
jgi:predicted MFS family arabinose efflux permease